MNNNTNLHECMVESDRFLKLTEAFNKIKAERPDVFGSYYLAKIMENGYALIDFKSTLTSPDKDFSFASECPAMAWHHSFAEIKKEIIQTFLDESVFYYLQDVKEVSQDEMFDFFNRARSNKKEGMGYGEEAFLMISEDEAQPIIEKCK